MTVWALSPGTFRKPYPPKLLSMRIAVFGAGLIGVTSSWYLAQDGHEVTVFERQTGPALETSFANGGQISASHALPWSHPGVLLDIVRSLGREDAPLLWRFGPDPDQWLWGLDFLRACSRKRSQDNMRAILSLALLSRNCLARLRDQLALEYDQLQRGILHLYTSERAFDRAQPLMAFMTQCGCSRIPLTPEQCMALEPALSQSQIPLAGGAYTQDDESGDAYQFCRALVGHCETAGVRFVYGRSLCTLESRGGRIDAAWLDRGEHIKADAYVVALGAQTAPQLAAHGLRTRIIPAKGYSLTLPLVPGSAAPWVSLTDDEAKIVVSRLGHRLRVAGTAEFSGSDLSENPQRCAALQQRISAFFPDLASVSPLQTWCGLRPSTPGNVPWVGATPLANLWINAGHGTLGWTMACGSGQLLADLVAQRMPAIDPQPYGLR
jgi:D-amino-acid dehydrogenase